jgi:5-methyltetrahydropteroyltriglutamate--homocysteine methyltransferase
LPEGVRAEHVGSLLRPTRLLTARADQEAGRISADALREIEDKAVLEAIQLQRDVGIDVFTDGEVRRDSFLASVLETVGGLVPLDAASSAFLPAWRRGTEITEADGDLELIIGGNLYRTNPLSLVEAEFMARHAPGQFKVTMASPSMVGNYWRPDISSAAYPSRHDAVAALADIYLDDIAALLDAGVTWLQIDSLNYWSNIDPDLAGKASQAALDRNMTRTIETDNLLIRAARAKKPDVTVAMHFCRGNMRSAWAAKGGYEPIAEAVFGGVEVDRFLLEFDTDRSGGFEPLRFVPPGRTVVLGLVSSKAPTLESPDDLRRRIDEASRYVPLDQLAISPQCGFASTKTGNLLTVDDQRRKLDLVVKTAEAVWG